jgi:hypothetical protein
VHSHDLDAPIATLTCVAILVSPLAWGYYLLLAVLPLAIVLQDLNHRHWPAGRSALTAVAAAGLLTPWLEYAGRSIAGLAGSPVLVALHLVPVAAIVLLAVLGARLHHSEHPLSPDP